MARKTEDKRHLFKRGAIWWVQCNRHGERIVQTTGKSELGAARQERDRILNPANLKDQKDRAVAVLAQVQSLDQQLARIEDSTVAPLIKEGWKTYLDQTNRPDTGPSTLDAYEQRYEAFAVWMAKHDAEVKEIRHVTQEHANAYARHLFATVSASTAKTHLNLLSLVWNVLESTARLKLNPWDKKKITRRQGVVHTRRELTIEELQRVCAAATGEMRVLLALGIYCGLRLADAALLEWKSVDMVRGVLSLIPMKTARRSGKRITLPCHPALLALLSETPSDQRRGHVLPRLAARYGQYAAALSKDVSDLFKSVGIETSASIPGSARKRPEAGFHSLRHTFVSLCAAGGVPQSVVQALVGHGSPAMTAHYTHIGLQTAQSAVACLPDVTGADAVTPLPVKTPQEDLETVLALLERLDAGGLKAAAAKVQELSKAQDGKAGGGRQAL